MSRTHCENPSSDATPARPTSTPVVRLIRECVIALAAVVRQLEALFDHRHAVTRREVLKGIGK